jgi:hypothetical protein
MLMKAKGYKAGYLNEYLAIGEAPEEVRNVFRQRSRWCKGQMQVGRGSHGKCCAQPQISRKVDKECHWLQYTSG